MIGLMDCNNFFVSCERLFRPDLWNKPVAVLSSNDGVIVARSNELKAMGVPMGMPLFQAKKLVNMDEVTLFSSNFTLYRDVSSRVMQILAEEVGECEIYSVDEAFFAVKDDITEADITLLRSRIMQKVGIPVSIGVSSTKTLAKVASELEKKQSGVCLLTAEKWQEISQSYPCGEVWNLGRATATKLQGEGVTVAAEFMVLDRSFVLKRFGIHGRRIQTELSGVVVHELGANSEDLRKSLTSSRSFTETCSKLTELESALSYHVSQVAEKLRQNKLLAGKMHVSVRPGRHSDWVMHSVRDEVVFVEPTNETKVMTKAALEVLRTQFNKDVPYKKAEITLSSIVPTSFSQPNLFAEEEIDDSGQVLDTVSDLINNRFGKGTLRIGSVLSSGARSSVKLRSQEYTTNWEDIPRVVAK